MSPKPDPDIARFLHALHEYGDLRVNSSRIALIDPTHVSRAEAAMLQRVRRLMAKARREGADLQLRGVELAAMVAAHRPSRNDNP